MSLALTGAALDAIGDRSRGASSFEMALRLANQSRPHDYAAHRYGSLTRDVAALTALASQSGRATMLPALFERIDQLAPRLRYTTTQEKAWLVLAAMALAQSGSELEVTIEGAAVVMGEDPVESSLTEAEIQAGVLAINMGADAWRTLTATGVPIEELPAAASSMSLSRQFYRIDGSPSDLSALAQNDRVVVVIDGQLIDNVYREMAVLDLLPAGFEIETTLSSGTYDWLPSLTPTQVQEARDDRYVAAFTIGNRYRPHAPDSEGRPIQPSFTVAYMVRVTTPGEFVLPAARAEDMYMPTVFARTNMGRVSVRQLAD